MQFKPQAARAHVAVPGWVLPGLVPNLCLVWTLSPGALLLPVTEHWLCSSRVGTFLFPPHRRPPPHPVLHGLLLSSRPSAFSGAQHRTILSTSQAGVSRGHVHTLGITQNKTWTMGGLWLPFIFTPKIGDTFLFITMEYPYPSQCFWSAFFSSCDCTQSTIRGLPWWSSG